MMLEKTSVQNKCKRIIVSFFYFLGFVFFGLIIIKPKQLDDYMLLESRFSQYVNELSMGKGKTIRIKESMLKYDYDELCRRNILKEYELNNAELRGITIRPDGDSLVINGTPTESFVPGVTKEYISLDKGEYFISSGTTGLFTYFEGWKEENHIKFTNVDECRYFYTDPDNCDYYRFTIAIEEGKTLDNEVISPLIVKINDEYEAEDKKAYVWRIKKSDWDSITEKEKEFFYKTLSFYKDYEWVSIRFEDGSGIQFIGQNQIEGEMDPCGRVY